MTCQALRRSGCEGRAPTAAALGGLRRPRAERGRAPGRRRRVGPERRGVRRGRLHGATAGGAARPALVRRRLREAPRPRQAQSHRGQIGAPKAGRLRTVPLTDRAARALDAQPARALHRARRLGCSSTRSAPRSTTRACGAGSVTLWIGPVTSGSASTLCAFGGARQAWPGRPGGSPEPSGRRRHPCRTARGRTRARSCPPGPRTPACRPRRRPASWRSRSDALRRGSTSHLAAVLTLGTRPRRIDPVGWGAGR